MEQIENKFIKQSKSRQANEGTDVDFKTLIAHFLGLQLDNGKWLHEN